MRTKNSDPNELTPIAMSPKEVLIPNSVRKCKIICYFTYQPIWYSMLTSTITIKKSIECSQLHIIQLAILKKVKIIDKKGQKQLSNL